MRRARWQFCYWRRAALAQQEARQNWRKTDPDLERDAATAGATLGARADKAAAEAAKYFSRAESFIWKASPADTAQKASAVAPLTLAPETSPNLDTYLAAQNTILRLQHRHHRPRSRPRHPTITPGSGA